MNAVIYARYSSHNQRDESIEGQIRECKDFANKNSITVIGEYIDRAISGKTDNRPSFQKLIKDSEKRKFDAVIMYTLDRFARNRYDSAVYKAKLKKNGVKIFYAKQPMPDTPEGIILESVLEGYAEYYSENLSRNIKRGMRENALKGMVMGSLPIGYQKSEDRTYKIDPIGAKIVKEIFTMYSQGKSAAQIIRWLNEQGYRTSQGNKFNKNSLDRILRNDKYIGTFRYDDIVLENKIPPIIENSLFEKVQVMLHHNFSSRARNKAKEDYLLSTKLFCGYCGSPMNGESGTSKTGKVHRYYKCSRRKIKHDCNKAIEKKEWIETLVVKYTVQKVLTDKNIELIADKAMELIEKESNDTSVVSGLQETLKDIDKKIQNVLSAIEQGIITSSTKNRLQELETQKREIETNIAKEETKKPFITKDHIIFWLNSFRNGNIHDIEYQRRIIDTLVNSVFLYDNDDGSRKIVITFNLSSGETCTIKSSDIDCLSAPKSIEKTSRCFFKFYPRLYLLYRMRILYEVAPFLSFACCYNPKCQNAQSIFLHIQLL